MFACKYDPCRIGPDPPDPWLPCGYPFDASCNLDLKCHDIINVSNIFFCNTTAILGNYSDFSGGYPGLPPPLIDRPVLTIKGDIDMCCNYILDISRIYFCGGPIEHGRNWIGVGSSFDISCNETFRLTTPSGDQAIILIGTSNELVVDASHVALRHGNVDTPALNFGIDGDHNSGMCYLTNPAEALGFSFDGSLEAAISSRHISSKSGSSGNPSYNFGIDATDSNTGMYSPLADTIGFAAGGNEKVRINDSTTAAATPTLVLNADLDTGLFTPTANTIGFSVAGLQKASINPSTGVSFIAGLNVGLPSPSFNSSTGLRRLSAIPANSWEDGYMGNSKELIILPNEFTDYDVRTGGVAVAGWGIGENTGRTNFFTGAMGQAAGGAGARIIAMKLVPKGFQISGENITVHVDNVGPPLWTGNNGPVWCGVHNVAATGADFTVWQMNVADGTTAATAPLTGTNVGTGNMGGGGVATWNAGTASWTIPIVSAGIISDGRQAIVVDIIIKFGSQMTPNDGLLSVILPMVRG